MSVMTCSMVIPAAVKKAWARSQNAVAVSRRSPGKISV
jgi:hypothetical protein